MKISDVTGHSVDIFYVLLLYSGKYSFLPELYDILGREKTIQMLDIFAGTTIEFPNEALLQKLAVEVSVYLKLKTVTKAYKSTLIKNLAREHKITPQHIATIYENVAEVIENQLDMGALNAGRRKKHTDSSK